MFAPSLLRDARGRFVSARPTSGRIPRSLLRYHDEACAERAARAQGVRAYYCARGNWAGTWVVALRAL